MDSETIDVGQQVESLVKKAEQTNSADEALKFSQAACNAANAMSALVMARKNQSVSPST